METDVMPRMSRTLEDAILLKTIGSIEVIGGVKLGPMIEGEAKKEKIKVDIKVIQVIGMHTIGRGLQYG